MSRLFNPGPTNVSSRVWEALNCGDICHREQEFVDCLNAIIRQVPMVVCSAGNHEAVMFGCSATGCNEAIFGSVFEPVILLMNGKYSERLAEIATRCNVPIKIVKLSADRPPTEAELVEVESVLKQRDEYSYVAFVHHETTTGAVLPLNRLGRAAAEGSKSLIVDTVSSFGILDIDVERDNIAFCTTSSNKGLQSLPGIGFVIARTTELEKARRNQSRSLYLDLPSEWKRQQKGQTRFTPAVQIAFACREAIEELLREGVGNRRRRYFDNARHLRLGLRQIGFKLIEHFSKDSPIITTVSLNGINYPNLHDTLKDKGLTIYSDDETLANGYFRIAIMGDTHREDIEQLLSILEYYYKTFIDNGCAKVRDRRESE